MSRVEIAEVVLDSNGRPVTGATVQINIRGGAAATVYAAETGGTTRTNPLTTAAGRIEGWLDPGSYDLVVSYRGNAYTQPYEAIRGSDQNVTVTDAGNLGATRTVSFADQLETWVQGTLNANHELTVEDLRPGARLVLLAVQDGTGGRTLTLTDDAGSLSVPIDAAAGAATRVEAESFDGLEMVVTVG